jgi:hypothetical protein
VLGGSVDIGGNMSRVKPSFWLFLANKSSFTPLSMLVFSVMILSFVYDAWILFKLETLSQFELPCLYMTIVFGILAIGIRIRYEWRKFQEISLIFKNGIETIGEVKEIETLRRQFYIRFDYEYQQEKYRSTEVVFPNQKTKKITVGQKVLLYIDQRHPITQAFIRDLYINTF